MAINIRERADLIAVSKKRQVASGSVSAAENPQTLDMIVSFDEGSKIDILDGRETNQQEKTGKEEPTKIDVGEREAGGALTKAKAQPNLLAWAFAMIANDHSETAAGASGFVHTSRMTYGVEPSFFTAAHRKGDLADMRRHTGLTIDSLGLTLTKGAGISTNLGIKGIGKADDQKFSETVAGLDNDTTLAFSNDIHGASPDNVTVWADTTADGVPDKEVVVTAVDNALNQLTIQSLGGAGAAVTYHLIYTPKNDVAGYTWANLGALSTIDEFHPRTKDIQLILGGAYDGSDIVGGQVAKCEISSVNYQYNANGAVQKCFRGGALPVDHATGIDLGDISQTLAVDRDIVDFIMGYWHEKNLNPALKIHAISPVEFETGHRFEIEIIFPKVGFMDNKHNVVDGKWSSQSSLVVLKDDSPNDYPSAVFKVKNQQTGYWV
ncbi:MAG: hypothetical protein ACE5GQ_08660 [Nitrospinales bacterium]